MDIEGDPAVIERDGYTEYRCRDDTRFWLEDGDTVENALVVLRGHYFNVHGVDLERWTVRHFGIYGAQPDNHAGFFSVGVSDEAILENVWCGDGARGDWRDKHQRGLTGTQGKAIFTHEPHTGQLHVRNFFAGPFPDNTFYCENQGSNGTIHFENVFVDGGCVSAFRVGGTGTHTMVNCHTRRPGWHPDADHTGMRDVWLRTATPTMEVSGGSQLSGDGAGIVADAGPVHLSTDSTAGGGAGDIQTDDGVGREPTPRIPGETPTSALAAATGDLEWMGSGHPSH